MKKIFLFFISALISVCGCVQNNYVTSDSSSTDILKTEPDQKSSDKKTSTMEDKTLIIDENPSLYTYEDMVNDLTIMEEAYGDFTSLNIIGETLDGRHIYDFVIGDTDAPQHAIIHASIHAREYITTKLVMTQLSGYLDALDKSTGSYNGKSYSELFDDVAVHVIPMVNPDGVTISQFGLKNIMKQKTLDRLKAIAKNDGKSLSGKYLTQWKSNANGVDLNRNYDALWDEYKGPDKPSSDHYKGTSPESEPETKALIDITKKYNVLRTISYHTYGEVIYWYFGQEGELLQKSKAFAEAVSDATGYPTDANYERLDPAGYKDWAISKLSIPSITIEVGHGSNPVPDKQFKNILNQNKDVWVVMLNDLNNHGGN